jgi:acetylornithine deacetylase/succinyl-diaminopimelate desuccinylase-like protein
VEPFVHSVSHEVGRLSEVAELARSLVAIDSANPDLVPGGAGEAEVAHAVAAWLERAGLEVSVQEVAPGRPNVVGVARGSGGGRTLLLNAHTDTVGTDAMQDPREARVESGRLWGRGSYDMKGSLAAIMLAGARAGELGLRGDVVVAAVVDEEVASIGTSALVERWRADGAIVAEPTEELVCIAHKGFVAFEIETRGRAAHGSRPDLGVDAIARMGHVLVGIERLDGELRTDPRHPLLGSGSVHASLIEGGQEYSSYPARCLLRGERRTIPGETQAQVEDELRTLVGDLDARIAMPFAREPFEVDELEPVVDAVRRHAGVGSVSCVPFWADSALLGAAGIPTVVFGPSGAGAHAEVEWVDVASLERCLDVYTAVAREFCA